jgi:hypothetical protein
MFVLTHDTRSNPAPINLGTSFSHETTRTSSGSRHDQTPSLNVEESHTADRAAILTLSRYVRKVGASEN